MPARAKAMPREGRVLRTPSPPYAADVESVTTSIVSVSNNTGAVSVTSSKMLDRQAALIRARELARKKNQLREAEAKAAAEAEAARHVAEAEAARRQAEAEADAARRRAEATQRQLQAELEERELDAELAELSSAKSRASEHSPPTRQSRAMSSSEAA